MTEIKVNAEQWDQLSEEEKSQIGDILNESNLLQYEYRIVGDADTPAFDSNAPTPGIPAKPKSNCAVACEASANLARAACASLLSPPANIVCLAVVEGGLMLCMKGCDKYEQFGAKQQSM